VGCVIKAVDLADPGMLWARWVALSAALTGVGFDDVWVIDDRGALHDDHGGNWARLTPVIGDRAVLYGYDHEYSATAHASPPIDLLAGAPDWLPWADLPPDSELGYVLWFEHGRWARVAYPGDVEDGLAETAGPVLDERAALAELADIVMEWAEADAVPAGAAEALLTAAMQGAAGPAEFAALLGDAWNAERGLAVATRRPEPREPGERPAARRVRRLSEREHDRLVWAAMREAVERDRPAPPPTRELDAVTAWMRGRAPHSDGRCSLLLHAAGTSLSTRRGEFPPAERPGDGRFGLFHEVVELAGPLRAAEAHPRSGRWLFLHVETTATDVTVERRYDSWPAWWADDGISGPWRTHLADELATRDERWQPSWAALLDPEVAYRQP
jgi:hypothetical protein